MSVLLANHEGLDLAQLSIKEAALAVIFLKWWRTKESILTQREWARSPLKEATLAVLFRDGRDHLPMIDILRERGKLSMEGGGSSSLFSGMVEDNGGEKGKYSYTAGQSTALH